MPASKEDLQRIDGLNYEAVMQTLAHPGKCMAALEDTVRNLQTQVVNQQQQLGEQRGLIVRSLQNRYGHGSTA